MNQLIIFGAKYLFLISGIVALYGFWKLPRERKKSIVILTAISFPFIYIVSKIGGALYNDPRPFVVGNFTPLIPHEADNGFPSDHTLLTSAIASVFFPYNKMLSIALFAVAIGVGTSRVFAGIHHPVDVLGSILISIVCVGLVHYVRSKRRS